MRRDSIYQQIYKMCNEKQSEEPGSFARENPLIRLRRLRRPPI